MSDKNLPIRQTKMDTTTSSGRIDKPDFTRIITIKYQNVETPPGIQENFGTFLESFLCCCTIQ